MNEKKKKKEKKRASPEGEKKNLVGGKRLKEVPKGNK